MTYSTLRFEDSKSKLRTPELMAHWLSRPQSQDIHVLFSHGQTMIKYRHSELSDSYLLRWDTCCLPPSKRLKDESIGKHESRYHITEGQLLAWGENQSFICSPRILSSLTRSESAELRHVPLLDVAPASIQGRKPAAAHAGEEQQLTLETLAMAEWDSCFPLAGSRGTPLRWLQEFCMRIHE